MPFKLVKDAGAIAKWVQAKQALEVKLSWELIDCFNKPALLDPIRAACAKAIEDMILAGKNELAAANAVKQAIDEEKANMKLLAKTSPQKGGKSEAGKAIDALGIINVLSLPKLLDQVDTFDCQECSDLIRLYGAFIEKAAGSAKELSPKLGATYAALLQEKSDVKKGAGGGAQKGVWNTLGQDGKPVMNEKTKKPWEFGRWRERKLGQYDSLFAKKAGPTMTGEQGYFDPHNIQQFLGMMKGGSSIWALKDGSTISIMDQLFGLVPASDISGTTTDTIHFLTKFIGGDLMGGLDHIYYMLPLATIVAGAHHSWLEVALPLTQSGIIDYQIGNYETAMVKKTTNKAAGELAKVLKTATADKDNRQLLIFYKKPKEIEAAYEFEIGDKYWAKLSSSDDAMAHIIKTKVKAWPSKNDIVNFAQAAAQVELK